MSRLIFLYFYTCKSTMVLCQPSPTTRGCCCTIDGCALARSFLYFNGVELWKSLLLSFCHIPIVRFSPSPRSLLVYMKGTQNAHTHILLDFSSNVSYHVKQLCPQRSCFHFLINNNIYSVLIGITWQL